MRTIEYEIDELHSGMQIDRFLKGKGYSRAIITALKKDDLLKLNGEHIRTVDTVKSGDIISVCFKDVSGAYPNASLNAERVYDDEDIVVFDKPAGIPVHTSMGHDRDTLANLFAALYPDSYFHAVSRLDKNTSGLIVIAKNKLAASRLMSDSACRPRKLYYAVTDRGFAEKYGETGEITAPIARENESIIRRIVREDGEYACTKYRVIYKSERYCLHEITLLTGRTHQIRVHFVHLGFPLIGDELYGGDTSVLSRQALHCGRLSFMHPVTGETHDISCDIPEDILSLFDKNIGKYCVLT